MKLFILFCVIHTAQVSHSYEQNTVYCSHFSKISAKIVIQKWDIQYDPSFVTIKYEIKDETTMSIESHCLADADDIVVSFYEFSVKFSDTNQT
jgi:hypothetical protein